MKFAKELEDNAVPEWREKYMDYKGAKKKLKAVGRAMRNADKSPSFGQPTPFSASLRDAPVLSFLARRQEPDETPKDNNLRHTRSRSEDQTGSATGASKGTQPIRINERSPLRAKYDGSAQETPAMRRYGSIIGTPPEHEALESTRTNDSQRQKPVSLLELPDAALDPSQPKTVQHREFDPEYDRPMSPGSDEASRRLPPPQPPNTQLSHTGNAYEVSKPLDRAGSALTAPRYRKLFRKNRTSSMPGNSRPFMRRMLSIAAPEATTVPSRPDDVALETYREIDFRQEQFFQYLDKQLQKVENFYSAKEEEATERLKAIREQLHVLRDRRWEEIVATEHQQHNPPPTGSSHGPNDQLDVPAPNGNDRRLSTKSWLAPVGNAVGHIDNVWDKARGSYVGKTSRKMEELASPNIPGRINRPPDRQDYVRRPPAKDVPYRVAKRKLKTAMAEFYRGLELLKSYALLNRTAFRKINKKYDKTRKARPTLRYMDKINKAHFVSSDVLEGHLHAVEDLYARYFERGNHKVAVNKLRSKIARAEDFTGSIWRQGVLLAAGSVFGIEGLVYAVMQIYSSNSYEMERVNYLLQLYAGYFFMVLLTAFFVLDARIFEKNKVNYQFVFEFVRPLNWRQMSEIPAYFYFLLGLTMWLNFHQFGGDTMYIYWPVILIGLSLILFLAPPPLFYPKTREWFLYTNWRLFFAGLYPVEFRDFFFGDMLCSLTYSLGNIELFFCLYSQHWDNPPVCNSSNSRLLGFFSTLPGIFRALQCVRRYWDTRNVFPHLVNCGKYTFTILYYMSLSLFRIQKSPQYFAAFIVLATINAIYCSIWDIFMDWSLMDLQSKNYLLRDTLAYKRKRYYYMAIPLDIVLRFNWIFYAIFAGDVGHSSIVSFCVALSEIFRRGIWVIFRVENEHCTNVIRSRASRDVPLPYQIDESTTALIDTSSEAEEQRRQGVRVDGAADQTPQATPQDLSRQPTRTTGTDVEHGQTTPGSLRRRPTFSADSPVARALRRVNSTMMSAHAQDYERKRRPETTADTADSDDDDDEGSSDSEDGIKKPSLRRHRSRRKHDDRRDMKSVRESSHEDGQHVRSDEERDRIETAEAEEALDVARPNVR